MARNLQFSLEIISRKFNTKLKDLKNFLVRESHEDLEKISFELEKELNNIAREGFLTVSIVGQYSAGKSTIVSALTGRNDIAINSDVTTSKTQVYDWNGIKIIDTPGLWADHEDHDSLTYKAIEKSDLLIFCLTHNLFDDVTIKNFKKLAYEKGYASKIMLIVNKMSKELGEENEKISNYSESLQEALSPFKLEEFPVCFIDAKDYRDGMKNYDDFLIEVSRFQTFIETLNVFVKKRGNIARFDPPVRITLKWIEQAKIISIRNSPQDKAVYEILNSLERRIEHQRENLRFKSKDKISKAILEIIDAGESLAGKVNAEQQQSKDIKDQTNNLIKDIYQRLESELSKVFIESIQTLELDIRNIRNGDLAQELINLSKSDSSVSFGKASSSGIQIDTLLHGIERRPETLFAGAFLAEILERSAINKETWTQLKEANKALSHAWTAMLSSPQGIEHSIAVEAFDKAQQHFNDVNPFHWNLFLSRESAEGSGLEVILGKVGDLGDSLGFHLDILDSVTATQIIGDISHCLSPAFTIFAVHAHLKKIEQEKDLENKMAKIREDIRINFRNISKNLEQKAIKRCEKLESDVYDSIVLKIRDFRAQKEKEVSKSNKVLARLSEIGKTFEQIRSSIEDLFKQLEEGPEAG